MKKMNKKGFTLAELLIVLAILAILIAIAIPVFTAQLENARLQADHANLRSAYAIVQTANIVGYKNVEGFESETTDTFNGATFCTDGKFHKSGDSTGTAVTLQAGAGKHDKDAQESCKACVVDCTSFKKNDTIVIEKTGDTYGIKKGSD